MANEKDLAEKILFDKNDVFADIINVLLFHGKEFVNPEDLAETGQVSQIKIANTDHQQERDVSKLWMRGKVRFALVGLENQTKVEPDIAMRTFSYDGAAYKEQVVHNRTKGVKKWDPYPVITIVLYFGRTHWKSPRSLKELFGPLPPEIDQYVNDYEVKIFEISFLSPETIAMFKSDFRIVADYFANSRKNKNYVGSPEEIIHVDAFLKLMSALTNDNRYEEQINTLKRKGGPVTMCEIVDNFIERGLKQGLEQGLKRGFEQGRKQGIEATKKESICAVADVFSVNELSKRFKISEQRILQILAEANITPILAD